MSNPFDKIFSDEMLSSSDMFPIISLDERMSDINIKSGDIIPILPLRNMVLYPGVLLPVSVARSKSLKLVRAANENELLIGVCSQIDKKLDDPTIDQLYSMGTSSSIISENDLLFNIGESYYNAGNLVEADGLFKYLQSIDTKNLKVSIMIKKRNWKVKEIR